MLPPKSVTDIVHCALPCMSGASASERPGAGVTLSAICSGAFDRRAAVVPAAERGEEDVLLAPHHALGHAGGAAGVEDVEVVGRAGLEVARRRRRRERVLVLDRGELVGDGAAAVVEDDEVLELREAGEHARDERSELGLVHERDEVGVVEQVAQLVGDVAVVDVDRHRAGLEAAEHRLDPLGAVDRVDADVLTRLDADVDEVVGETGRPLVELARR